MSSSFSNSGSSCLNLLEAADHKTSMDLAQSSEHLCYVRCSFCNTILAFLERAMEWNDRKVQKKATVGIPCKKLLDTVTVKCGHCGNLSFLSSRPPLQPQCFDHQPTLQHQDFFSNFKKGQSSSSSEPSSPKAPFVVKPPEKKHRLPSAYNRFMKEEIQRIKAAHPEIPHREAFSAAAKNWARYIPNTPNGTLVESSNNA